MGWIEAVVGIGRSSSNGNRGLSDTADGILSGGGPH